jgi:hypothetical protein
MVKVIASVGHDAECIGSQHLLHASDEFCAAYAPRKDNVFTWHRY